MIQKDYNARNEALTAQAKSDPKYAIFLKWLVQNGAVINPCVEYPVAFGPRGYIGIATTEDLNPIQPIIAIPKLLIIDVNRVI